MLKLDGLGYRYRKGNVDVLHNVNAEFEAGKINAIVGPSGSGKTTLLSIMAGMDKPQTGVISIDGKNLAELDLNQYRRERVAMIFQAFHLFPLLTSIENVCYPLEAVGTEPTDAVARAKSLLESVGISEEKHNRYPANLSGGEQQRVAIARALSVGAKVILADEPTGNLDTDNSNAVIEILKHLAHVQGYCIVIVTHNPEIADAADAVFRMKDGVLSQDKAGAPKNHGASQKGIQSPEQTVCSGEKGWVIQNISEQKDRLKERLGIEIDRYFEAFDNGSDQSGFDITALEKLMSENQGELKTSTNEEFL